MEDTDRTDTAISEELTGTSETAVWQIAQEQAAGSVGPSAHELNNLLSVILCNLELLEMRIADQRLRKLAQAGARAAERAVAINAEVLALTRKLGWARSPDLPNGRDGR
jgi:hypothetical protein